MTLRPLGVSDIPALVMGVGNYDVSKWLSVVPYPYNEDDARDFLGREAAAPGKAWGICDADGLWGVIGLEDELGYWLARPAWGRGYATEAARAVVAAWFEDAQAGPVRSGYFAGNAASGRVLEKVGFLAVGTRRRAARALAQEVDSIEMELTRARWAEVSQRLSRGAMSSIATSQS